MENEKVQGAAVAHPRRTCPVCKDGDLRRIKREAWVALVPFSKYYNCSRCKTSFLRIFDFVQFKMKRVGSKSPNSKKEFALVVFTIIATIYVCYRIVIVLHGSSPQ
jgi:hypothetical protein